MRWLDFTAWPLWGVVVAFADLAHRRAHLEHAAASLVNLVYGAVLITLLAIPLVASGTPEVTVWAVHPATAVLVAAYLFGLHLAARAKAEPLWHPEETPSTTLDVPHEEAEGTSTARLWTGFAVLALLLAASGWVVAQSGIALVERTGLSESLVGAAFTGVATSLPELVTAISAVRMGAPTLAVGEILGGNGFDVLFLAFSDVAYRRGSIYHHITGDQAFLVQSTILLTAILLVGMLRRQRKGVANIGFKSALLLVLCAGMMAILAT